MKLPVVDFFFAVFAVLCAEICSDATKAESLFSAKTQRAAKKRSARYCAKLERILTPHLPLSFVTMYNDSKEPMTDPSARQRVNFVST